MKISRLFCIMSILITFVGCNKRNITSIEDSIKPDVSIHQIEENVNGAGNINIEDEQGIVDKENTIINREELENDLDNAKELDNINEELDNTNDLDSTKDLDTKNVDESGERI